jgi:phosphoribosylanthranilate isomerase
MEMKPRVKICCIASVEEARLAIRYGASAVGLVSEMPSGPGVISEKMIVEIAEMLPPTIGSFLLTSKQDADSIITQQKFCKTNTIQLCDQLASGSYEQLRKSMPGVKLVQVIHVNDQDSIEEAKQVSTQVDAILLDSGNQTLPVKELGGTGRVHNWEISRKIRDEVDRPVFLAGGLSIENVAQAIRKVRPFALDICSGVRTDGKLDEYKLRAFFQAVNSRKNFN